MTYAAEYSKTPPEGAATRATRSTPIRRVLLRGAENLTEKAYGRLLAGLGAGDPGGQVAAAYIAAQELRHLYGDRDLTQARHRLHRFYLACADRRPRSRTPRAHLLRLGRPTAGPFHHRRGEQRTTGAVNLIIKRINRVGFGFRNFANYRL